MGNARFFQGIITLIVLLLAAGCASSSPAFYGPPPLSERVTSSQNFWRHSGVPFHGDEVSSWALSGNGRIQNIVDRLVYVSPLRGYDIRAGILDSSSANAGTDGNTIFITSPLLYALGYDESMIAAVLAHELGHIIAHHAAIRNSPTAVAIQSALPLLSMTNLGSYAGLAMSEGMRLYQRSYSRLDEKEADAIGAILTYEAGYDPYGLNRFFDAKAGASGGIALPQSVPIPVSTTATGLAGSMAVSLLRASPLYRTHPPSPERKVVVDLIARTKSGQMSIQQLAWYDPWLAYVYTVIEARRPKSRPSRQSP